MDKAALLALADRVEALDGPDRNVDGEVIFELYAKPVGQKPDGGPVGYIWPEDNPSWNLGLRFYNTSLESILKNRDNHKETIIIERDGGLVLINSMRIPSLTGSIDAAITLIPDGFCVSAMGEIPDDLCWYVVLYGEIATEAEPEVRAQTLPLAITAAALRAIAEGCE